MSSHHVCCVLAYRKLISSAACPIANATPEIMGAGYLRTATWTELKVTSFLSDNKSTERQIDRNSIRLYTKEN